MFEEFKIFQEMGWMVVLIIGLLAIWLVLKQMGKRKKRFMRSPSLNHLRQRYLKGEIDDSEYERQKEKLQSDKEN